MYSLPIQIEFPFRSALGDLLLVRENLQLAFKSGDQCTISPARGNCEMIFIETPNTVICGPLLMAARWQVFF
jgi:hypothetical protein